MNIGDQTIEIGGSLGHQAVEQMTRYAGEICEHERQRLALVHEAAINQLNVEGADLTRAKYSLEERLRLAPPAANQRFQRRKILYSALTSGLLVLAGFFLALISLEPFRLGSKAILFCVGAALAIAFLTELFLESWNHRAFFKATVTIAFMAAIVGGALLAEIRGDLAAQQVQSPAPSLTIDDTPSVQPPQQENSFYQSTGPLLKWLMVLLSVAMDLGAGIAAHRAMQLSFAVGEDPRKLARELDGVNVRLGEVVFEITTRRNTPAEFEKRFWREFYKAMLTQAARKAMTKIMITAICLGLGAARSASAQEHLNLVIAIDLSASEAVRGRDGQSQFEKNLIGVRRVLEDVPAGATVTILGITEDSFSQPYILLPARVSEDAGYFGEKLQSARHQLVSTWIKRASVLNPAARGTDILGAVLIAAQILNRGPENQQKLLILFSDMRNAARGFNFERVKSEPVEKFVSDLRSAELVPDLHTVLVGVVGANGVGVTASQRQTIANLWYSYFRAAGATLKFYSVLSDPVELTLR